MHDSRPDPFKSALTPRLFRRLLLPFFAHVPKMSMLNKLKESQKNPVFMDDDDIDNMDFPLPGSSNDAMPDLQSMMRNMSVNTPPPPPSAASAAAAAAAGPAVVVMTPQGVRRLDPSEYKK